MLAGVCGGLGQYFDIDPVVFRVIFCVLGLTGSGIIAYIVLMFVIPAEENSSSSSKFSGIKEEWIDEVTKEIKKEITEEVREEIVSNVRKHGSSFAVIAGATLIIIGFLLLFPHFHWRYLLPVAFIALGLMLLVFRNNR